MCRFTVYKGRPLLLGDILIRPDNSLLVQARDAAYHPGVEDCAHRRNIVVNGDGFGLAWYVNDAGKGACCCKFLTPAWSNSNLRNLGDYVLSPLIIGHIRAASSGHNPYEDVAISTENCHPFKHGRWTFVHNGVIPQFKKIKRAMVMLLKDECYHEISGSTDSECIFALFLSLLPDRDAETRLDDLIFTVNFLISTILELMSSASVTEPCSLNICITDGTNIVATRFRNGPEQPPSLYYKYGSEFKCIDGNLFSCDHCPPSEVIISSAPLSKSNAQSDVSSDDGRLFHMSDCGEDDSSRLTDLSGSFNASPCSEYYGANGWHLIPKDHMLVCTGDPSNISQVKSVRSQKIEAEVSKGLVSLMRQHGSRSVDDLTKIKDDAVRNFYEIAFSPTDLKILTGYSPVVYSEKHIYPSSIRCVREK